MKWWPWTSRAGSGASHPHTGARVVARRYHLHTPGIVYVGTTMLLSAGAANSQNNLLFWAFGLAVGGLIVSGLLSGIALMRVGIERLDSDGVSAGEPLRTRYRITNRGFILPCYAVHVAELAGDGDSTMASDMPAGFADAVSAGHDEIVDGIGAARPRGVVRMQRVRLWSTFPLGIAKKSVTFDEPQTLRVWPRVWVLKDDAILPPPRGGERSRMTPRLSSDGAELFSLRAYQDGDPVRTIAWRPSARSQDLLVRQTAESSTARVRVVLRVPEGGSDPSVLEDAISLAASVFIHLERTGVAVSLHAPALGVHTPSGQGRQHVRRMLDELALAAPDRGGSRITARGGMRIRSDADGQRVVVVHAGPAESATGGAQHLSALKVNDYRAEHVDAPTPAPVRRGWLARLRGRA